MTDPADTLRRAAERLRTLAEAATPGPWTFENAPNGMAPLVVGADMAVAETFDKPHLGDAAYIAAMSPPVALAVADWLVFQASVHEGEDWVSCDCEDSSHALHIARLVLGEEADG